MTLKFDTTHEYYVEPMNVGYIESMNCLFVQDTDENTININGVDADNFIRCIRNTTSARDKIFDHIKNVDHSNDFLKEIYDDIGIYLKKQGLIKEAK
tara:strand:+ start:77 stop:367 length:291 start_codon:yes stop_codon:yes gene_type:complete